MPIPIQIDVTYRKDKVTVTATFCGKLKITGSVADIESLCVRAANDLCQKYLTDSHNAAARILNNFPDLPEPVRIELAKLAEIPTVTMADLKLGPTITKHL